MPAWLKTVAAVSLAAGAASALVVALDIVVAGRRQHVKIMNLVWPLTALYSGPVGLFAYLRIGRAPEREAASGHAHGNGPDRPFWQSVGLAATHCGSGCTLGDIIAEWFTFLVPLLLLGSTVFAAWAVDYALAFGFGIAFQYFTIKPLRGLSVRAGLIAAVKADALSLTAWQLGMYGWMGVALFAIFTPQLPKTGPVFWFMMQIAMMCGFLTSYPVNWWLLRRGIKERM